MQITHRTSTKVTGQQPIVALEDKFSGRITGSNYFNAAAELPNFAENVYN